MPGGNENQKNLIKENWPKWLQDLNNVLEEDDGLFDDYMDSLAPEDLWAYVHGMYHALQYHVSPDHRNLENPEENTFGDAFVPKTPEEDFAATLEDIFLTADPTVLAQAENRGAIKQFLKAVCKGFSDLTPLSEEDYSLNDEEVLDDEDEEYLYDPDDSPEKAKMREKNIIADSISLIPQASVLFSKQPEAPARNNEPGLQGLDDSLFYQDINKLTNNNQHIIVHDYIPLMKDRANLVHQVSAQCKQEGLSNQATKEKVSRELVSFNGTHNTSSFRENLLYSKMEKLNTLYNQLYASSNRLTDSSSFKKMLKSLKVVHEAFTGIQRGDDFLKNLDFNEMLQNVSTSTKDYLVAKNAFQDYRSTEKGNTRIAAAVSALYTISSDTTIKHFSDVKLKTANQTKIDAIISLSDDKNAIREELTEKLGRAPVITTMGDIVRKNFATATAAKAAPESPDMKAVKEMVPIEKGGTKKSISTGDNHAGLVPS